MNRTLRIGYRSALPWRTVGALVFIGFLMAGVLFLWKDNLKDDPVTGLSLERNSVLVMPINSGPAEQDRYLAGLITSEIISSLNRSPSLRVLSIPQEFAASKNQWSQKIIRQNIVNFTLSGDISLGGERLRLSARIIDQRNFQVIWSRVFNEDISRIFAIPTIISSQVAFESGVLFNADQLKFPGREAFDLYTRADMLLSSYDPAQLSQSIDLFRECKAVAPDFRPVYEKLGLALLQYRNTGLDYNPQYLDQAYQIIREGRDRQGDSPLLSTLEIWYHLYSYDFAGAKAHADRMKREGLEPLGRKHLVWLSFLEGNVEQGLDLLEDSIRREPFEPSYHLNRVVLNTMLGKRSRVEQAYDESREIYRSPMVDAIIEGWRAMADDDFNAAFIIFNRLRQDSPYHLMDLACAESLFCQGDYIRSAQFLESWLGQNPYAMEGWWLLCMCYELLKDETKHKQIAADAVKYADILIERQPSPFLKTARAYFRLLKGISEDLGRDMDVMAQESQDSLTRYLRHVIQLRLGQKSPDEEVPIPYNPTYWMNRFYSKEIDLIRNS